MADIKKVVVYGPCLCILYEDGFLEMKGEDIPDRLKDGFSGVKDIIGNGELLFIVMNQGRILMDGTYFSYHSGSGKLEQLFYELAPFSLWSELKSIELGQDSYCYTLLDGSIRLDGFICGKMHELTSSIRFDEHDFLDPEINTDSPVVKVKLDNYRFIALLENGSTIVFGDNRQGVLGLGEGKSHQIEKMTKNDYLKDVKDIFLNKEKSFFALENGDLIAFGQNALGELGTGDYTMSIKGEKVIGVTDVKSITNCYYITSFLMNDSTIKICGENSEDIARIGINGVISIPKKANKASGSIQILDDYNISLYVGKDSIYGFGYMDYDSIFLKEEYNNKEGKFKFSKLL